MTPGLRKFGLTAHIILSVGWLGAVAGFLALAVAGLTSQDARMVRAAYLAMEFIGWYVIVPFSLATLLAGLVQSLGTTWGLFRHYWVLAKLLLTVLATIVLLLKMEQISNIADVAAETTLFSADLREARIELVAHAGGGLLVLLAATVLSVYKPWGMTPYGRRKASLADWPSHPESDVGPGVGSANRTPRWVYVVGIHAIGLALLFLVMHLTGGGLRIH